MSCTTILVGKKASYDGSTMIARNDDASAGHFTPKKMAVGGEGIPQNPYRSVLSHVELTLPEHAFRFSMTPNALEGKGLWAAAGVNEKNVGMTATETIVSNERVLGADPLVRLVPEKDGKPERPGGIGEEDLLLLVLPYVESAREGVLRLGSLLAQYGTYEMNGIAISDKDEIWWMETIGGHHWIAKRVPDEACVVMPNQNGIDSFDLTDAFGEKRAHLCSEDLLDFIRDNHLDLQRKPDPVHFDARLAFGTRSDSDHVYNTPRAWYMLLRLLPSQRQLYEGQNARYFPESDDLPWCVLPDRKITPEDIKYLLSSHYQGTAYDVYSAFGDRSRGGMYRPIGVNRTDFLGMIQIRPDLPDGFRSLEWIAFGSNVFNAMIPLYPNVRSFPDYLTGTGEEVSTESFYWVSRLIGALADASMGRCLIHIERYQNAASSRARGILREADREMLELGDQEMTAYLEKTEAANEKIVSMIREEAGKVLDKVLFERSMGMKNSYARPDA